PKIASARYGVDGQGDLFVRRIGLLRFDGAVEDYVDLGGVPAEDFDRYIVEFVDGREFDREHLLVPDRELGEAVVGEAVGADLGRAPVMRDKNGDPLHSEPPRGGDTRLASDDRAGLVNKHRHRKSELSDRSCEAHELPLRMFAGIAIV